MWVIRSLKSKKDEQYNDKQKKDQKQADDDLQNTTQEM